ncbi:MAG: hypothetical protein L3J30_05485 [Marinosulfonomonas sp.]|nr:hypothetical protein [Marinosulfonomonas sp.]
MSRARYGEILVFSVVILAALTLWLLLGADGFSSIKNGLSPRPEFSGRGSLLV